MEYSQDCFLGELAKGSAGICVKVARIMGGSVRDYASWGLGLDCRVEMKTVKVELDS